MLNESKGNMYPFVTHTFNGVKGVCPHECTYCYMKGIATKPPYLDQRELKVELGDGKFIFVGSSTDMWTAPDDWIDQVLEHCCLYPQNKYLFQTKNPERFSGHDVPPLTVLACTIETNRVELCQQVSKAPSPKERGWFMGSYAQPTMISIEPVMDFDVVPFVEMIQGIAPQFVSIGADSKHHNLPEPSPEKLRSLIRHLSGFTKIVLKKNLNRLLASPGTPSGGG